MKTEKQFDPIQMAEKLVNDWLTEVGGLPITLALSKLGFLVVDALEQAYQYGQDDIERKPPMDDVE
jgi:hypothetical protein